MSVNDKDPMPAVVPLPGTTAVPPQDGAQDPGVYSSATSSIEGSEFQMFCHNLNAPVGLKAIQIVIGVLILCLSASVLQVHEVHFTGDVALFLVVVIQVKVVLVLHLISAAFSTAALGLMSKHLPYRQDSYHCEHCHRLELHAVLLIDGILVTLVIFLVLELLICITAMLFGLSSQTEACVPTDPPPPVPAVQVSPAVAETSQVAVIVTEADSDEVEEISTPPTEPQVEPIEDLTSEP
ncbi:hypothetical protein F7725_025660 [Dissostichus mawsoni]|uniref:Uncharacterized protein n=1 Tax=Dissostichus mawsoni TaxID=36200 RepID=A0A7J5XBR4_DISMA|nr:hypothetical protein F7725_025660 [Dissostichus mawsoni]